MKIRFNFVNKVPAQIQKIQEKTAQPGTYAIARLQVSGVGHLHMYMYRYVWYGRPPGWCNEWHRSTIATVTELVFEKVQKGTTLISYHKHAQARDWENKCAHASEPDPGCPWNYARAKILCKCGNQDLFQPLLSAWISLGVCIQAHVYSGHVYPPLIANLLSVLGWIYKSNVHTHDILTWR